MEKCSLREILTAQLVGGVVSIALTCHRLQKEEPSTSDESCWKGPVGVNYGVSIRSRPPSGHITVEKAEVQKHLRYGANDTRGGPPVNWKIADTPVSVFENPKSIYRSAAEFYKT